MLRNCPQISYFVLAEYMGVVQFLKPPSVPSVSRLDSTTVGEHGGYYTFDENNLESRLAQCGHSDTCRS